MPKEIAIALCLLTFCSTAVADRNVRYTADFESGHIQGIDSDHDGLFVHTLPHPQKGSVSVKGNVGGFGIGSDLDTRVVRSEIVGSQTVLPRQGKHFIRSALYYDKDYSELSGGLNKPRSKIYINSKKHGVKFDEEGYLGFSIFLPTNWEHETGTKGPQGSIVLLQVQSHRVKTTLLALRVYVPKGASEAHWFLKHHLSDSSVAGGKMKEYDLGSVTGDLGKWTDFILRYRFNPFSVKTNASGIPGGKDQVYEGNRGILQLWKSQGSIGPDGNRKMVLTAANLENEPVGLVPNARRDIYWHFRLYKYGWHRNETHVKGPVWAAFDEIRDGRVLSDGTSYADVHPAGLSCSDSCPARVVPAQTENVPLAPSTGVTATTN